MPMHKFRLHLLLCLIAVLCLQFETPGIAKEVAKELNGAEYMLETLQVVEEVPNTRVMIAGLDASFKEVS